MHCAICREIGHNRSKCPTKNAAENPHNDEESEIRRVEEGEAQTREQQENEPQNSVQKVQKPKTAKELRRLKIPIRRKGKEVPSQELPNQGQANTVEPTIDQDDEVPDLEKDDVNNEPLISNDRGKYVDELAFFKNFPRKKMPLIQGQTEDWQESGRDYAAFQQKLRGDIGFKAVFMPTPGQLPFRATGGTPPVSTPPVPTTQSSKQANQEVKGGTQSSSKGGSQSSSKQGEGKAKKAGKDAQVSTQQSSSSAPSRRSTRLMSQNSFKFSNTEEDPIDIDLAS
ncbi:hypothetical protein DCAR_0521212 [Daucus carota subsp. sativus]|uniref:Uncharacterized protein n=2 Tax=Daucus carota subsp. sativus TaxID=79200 RepID=A0A161YKZ9_DAUCS|nr:hypothetical protein DCAR_0521212 [Daucus carota subsp. sativus]